MKKGCNIFLVFFIALSITSCSKGKVKTDVSNVAYVEVTDSASVAKNIELASQKIKGFKINGEIMINEKKYVYNGEVVLNETILESEAHIKINGIDIYWRKGKGYVSYFYDGTNIIVKDDIHVFIKEIIDYLNSSGIEVDKERLISFIDGNILENIDYINLGKKIKLGEKIIINSSDLKVCFNDDYLFESIEYKSDKMFVSTFFKYDSIRVNIPLGYNLLTLKVDNVKNLLKLDSIISLLK